MTNDSQKYQILFDVDILSIYQEVGAKNRSPFPVQSL